MNDTIIGIDLGTTNSAVSILKDGRPVMVDVDGQNTMPSCVGLDDNSNLLVGIAARNQIIANPERTVSSIKRNMGENVRVSLGEEEHSPETISSMILAKLKKESEVFLGESLKKAVITVPAYFDDHQRKATKDAGVLAGLDVVRIINEPTAASLAYEADQLDKNEKILVYDLGGGTFDASLVVVEEGVVLVKSSHGDTHLGGDDFDMFLVDHVAKHFNKEHKIDLKNDLKSIRRLKVLLEKVKIELSDQPYVKVNEEYLFDKHHLIMEIRRSEYEDMIRPMIQKTLDCVSQCLKDASYLPKDIDKIMLVGGASQTPLVYNMLKDTFKIEPRFEINPDLIVSMGAAVQGGLISGEDTHSILVDITPHTFGTRAISFINEEYSSDVFVPVIKCNTPLPVCKAEIFYSSFDNQEEVIVDVYEGEEPVASNNTLVGNFRVEGLSKAPRGNPIIINMELDVNGILIVTAKEKVTGFEKKVTINTKDVHKPIDILREREKLGQMLHNAGIIDAEAIEIEDIPSEKRGIIDELDKLERRANKLLDEGLEEEDAKEIRDLQEEIKQTKEAGDWDQLSKLKDSLSDVIFYLEQ